VGAAVYLEAELLRSLGDQDAAEAAYVRANELGRQPQPGLALLRLAQGRVAEADPMIQRASGEAENPIERSRLLPAVVEIAVAAGELDQARAANEELRSLGSELGSTMLKAHAARGAGAVLLATGDAAGALVELRRAATSYRDLSAPFDLARTRLLVAEACRRLGDDGTAALEESAATDAIEACRSGEGGSAVAGSASEPPDGLTGREIEVLLLLARGKTNRIIGEELFISEKTVASHVSHIFTKLGVASRSAATAYAYDRGLVEP
jgi:DNA-binding NarL/FixJ family response regulator